MVLLITQQRILPKENIMIPTFPDGSQDNHALYMFRHVTDLEGKLLIQRVHDGAWVSQDERNGDYRRYLAWVAKGNVPEELDYRNPEHVQKVTDREAEDGKLSRVERIDKYNAIAIANLAKQVKS